MPIDDHSDWLQRLSKQQTRGRAADQGLSEQANNTPARRIQPASQPPESPIEITPKQSGHLDPESQQLLEAEQQADAVVCGAGAGGDARLYQELRLATRNHEVRQHLARLLGLFLQNTRPEWRAVAWAAAEALRGRPPMKFRKLGEPPPETDAAVPQPLPAAQRLAALAGLTGSGAAQRARRALLGMARVCGLTDAQGGVARGWAAYRRARIPGPPQAPWRLFELRFPSASPDVLGIFESRGVPREHAFMLLAAACAERPPFDGRADGREVRLARALADELRRANNGRVPHRGWYLIHGACQFVLEGIVSGTAWLVVAGHDPAELKRQVADDPKLSRAVAQTTQAVERLRKRAAGTR